MSEPSIIYEDKNFLAVNKPAGWLTHQTGHGEANAPALTDWLLKRYPEIEGVGEPPVGGQANLRPGIVHRLDKDTSGIILVPRNQKYFSYLKSLFKERRIKKTYLALVWGTPKEKTGKIDAAIGIKSGTIRRAVGSEKMSKPAVTDYRILKTYKNEAGNFFALLEVSPLTGRTHQIRVHLKHIGHPIVGDPIYGRKSEKLRRELRQNRRSSVGAPTGTPTVPSGNASEERPLMLHAEAVEFEIEPGRKIKLVADPPEEFARVLSGLRPTID